MFSCNQLDNFGNHWWFGVMLQYLSLYTIGDHHVYLTMVRYAVTSSVQTIIYVLPSQLQSGINSIYIDNTVARQHCANFSLIYDWFYTYATDKLPKITNHIKDYLVTRHIIVWFHNTAIKHDIVSFDLNWYICHLHNWQAASNIIPEYGKLSFCTATSLDLIT